MAAYAEMLEKDHSGEYIVVAFPNFPSSDNSQLYFGRSSEEARARATAEHPTSPKYTNSIGIERPDYARGAVSPIRR